MKKSPVRTIVAIGIGAALFFVLGRFVAIPSPVPNTNISVQYGSSGFHGRHLRPCGRRSHRSYRPCPHRLQLRLGRMVELGHRLRRVRAALMGLVSFKLQLADGLFAKADVVKFNLFQIVGHIVAWALVAPVLDIAMYKEPVNKVFVQGLVGGVANIVTTAIVGTLLCLAYAAAKPKKGSLKEEE